MPPGKGYKRKRTKRKLVKKGYTRKIGFYGRMSGNAQELKFIDEEVTTSPLVPTGTMYDSFNKIVQGAGESQRIGRKCILRKFSVRGLFTLKDQHESNMLRLLFYVDTQANGLTATITDVFQDAVPSVQSYNKLSNKGRFKVIYDKRFVLNRSVTAAVGAPEYNKYFQFYKNMRIPIEFSGATGVMTEIRSNNIGGLAICENGSSTGILVFMSRIRFSE